MAFAALCLAVLPCRLAARGLSVARTRAASRCLMHQLIRDGEAAPPHASLKRERERKPHADFAIVKSIGVPPHVTRGTRLPDALALLASDQFPSLSSARKSVRRRLVLINGEVASCAAAVSPGDTIALQVRCNPGYAPRGMPPFAVDVIYQDDHLAVVYKPAGVVTHPPPGGASGSRSMRTAIAYALAPPPMGTPQALYRPHLVHRLDKPTSGLMLVAKTKPAQLGLQQLFVSRSIEKRYSAIVAGYVLEEDGIIDSPIDGRDARTKYEVAGRHRSLRMGGGHLTSLRLWPKTGRTHQLRIHCAEVLGCPIVGDSSYGFGKSAGGDSVGESGANGLYLSAVALRFTHPCHSASQTPVQFEVVDPEKFDTLRRRENQRWLKFHAQDQDSSIVDNRVCDGDEKKPDIQGHA